MRLMTTIATGVVLGAALAPGALRAAPPPVERPGVYVVAADLERSAAFYEKLFAKAPQVRTPGLIGFDVAGGLYAVVAKDQYARDATIGGNVVPYLRVGDIDGWFAHVRAAAPGALVTPAVVREGPIALIKLRDPDGNMVELFSVAAAR